MSIHIRSALDAEILIAQMQAAQNTTTWKTGGGWGDCITVDGMREEMIEPPKGKKRKGKTIYSILHGSGFKPYHALKVGHLLQCPMKSGRTAIFEFTEVDNMRDPHDMFFWKAKWIGKYTDELPEETL